MTLVFWNDEGPPEFHGGLEHRRESGPHPKQGMRVESACAIPLHDDPALPDAVGTGQFPGFAVPQNEVLVVQVVFVEVERPVGPLAHRPEGLLAATANFLEQARDACCRGEVNVKFAVGKQFQPFDFSHLRGEGFLQLSVLDGHRRLRQAQSRKVFASHLKGRPQRIGPGPQEAGQLFIALEALDIALANGPPDAHAKDIALLVAQFGCHPQRTQGRMDQAEKLKERAVGPIDVHWNNGAALLDGPTGHRGTPTPIGHHALRPAETRHPPRRKDPESTP